MPRELRDLEDAHDGDATLEHLRVVTPVAPKPKRVDAGDLVIWGGWLLAALLLGSLITVLIYALN